MGGYSPICKLQASVLNPELSLLYSNTTQPVFAWPVFSREALGLNLRTPKAK